MRTVTVSFLLGVLALLTPSAAGAQDWSALRKDPAVENYTLSMDKIRKFVEVQRAIVALHAKDAAEFSAIDKEFKEAQKGNARPTTADAAAIVDRHTSVRDTLTKAGTTSKEWLLTSSALNNLQLQTMFQGKAVGTSFTPHTDAQKANIALIEKNHDEWQKIDQELKQIGTQMATSAKR